MYNKYRPFEEAKYFVHSLNLKSENPDWRRYCKSDNKPDDIPRCPNIIYKDDWQCWGDWLGTNSRRGGWLPFLKAKAIVVSLKLSGQKEWRLFCKSEDRPTDIPANPNEVYKEWSNWGDWLGTNRLANKCKVFLAFKIARKIVRNKNFKNTKEFRKWIKPHNIPAAPNIFYPSWRRKPLCFSTSLCADERVKRVRQTEACPLG